MKKILSKIAFTLFYAVIFASCSVPKNSVRNLQRMEEGVSNPTTIEEYKAAIAKYERRVADIETANEQIGIWYKILGSRYIDKNMYGEALKCYQKAIEYYPQNQNLYYYVGLCSGYMAKSALDYDATGNFDKRHNYLRLSEAAYLRAIAIDPRYVYALYGLGSLYVFEFDESAKAIPYLETLLTINTGHVNAKMLLANAYYRTADFQKAADMYDNIIAAAKDKEIKAIAEKNKKIVLDMAYVQ
ncbi:MAG: tetratricopeptide repeat protein [Treponema sp.]|nr:tetratricopeptide repeat protein [Treponema sp.]